MTEQLPGFGAIARPRTFLNVVLDKSDSMDDIRAATVKAFNAFLDAQRGARVDELFVTLTTFSNADEIRVLYQAKPIAEVQPLQPRDYQLNGSTALYDAIAKACADTDQAVGKGDRVVICIVTDGGENASRVVKQLSDLLAIKATYEERRNWTFTFLAAGAEAYEAAQRLQIAPGNLRTYAADAEGMSTAMATVSANLKTYRQGDDLQTETFFNPPQQHPKPNWAKSSVVLTDSE